MTKEQIKKLAKAVNKKIDIPAMPEFLEESLIRTGIKKVDEIIREKLPEEIYLMVENSADGISDDEAKIIRKSLINAIDKQTDKLPPFIDAVADMFVPVVVDEFIQYLKKGISIL